MTELKTSLNNNLALDPSTKSSYRIMVETMLIDLNEEIFLISEELARSIGTPSADLNKKAEHFNRKKKILVKKIEKELEAMKGLVVRRKRSK